GVEIASLAMGCLNSMPYATMDVTEKWVLECIDVMEKMGQKIVLVAFFGKGDINGKPELQAKVVEKLKRAAPKAEKAGEKSLEECYVHNLRYLREIFAA